MRFTCSWIYFLTRVNVENCNFFTVIEGFNVYVCMYAKMTVTGVVFKFYLLTRVKSFFRTRKPVRAIEFYVLSGVRITCFWRAFTLIFYWRQSGHSKSYVLTRFTCMWGSCWRGLTCTFQLLQKPQASRTRWAWDMMRWMHEGTSVTLVTSLTSTGPYTKWYGLIVWLFSRKPVQMLIKTVIPTALSFE